jgi:hypothetical protein
MVSVESAWRKTARQRTGASSWADAYRSSTNFLAKIMGGPWPSFAPKELRQWVQTL